ncbi:carbohydrate kinase [Mycetocola tolaasinivorans]|uniref:Carbohydrate kinase n=1 Tax=Mycetocola tolaasinivorans TaxID=76635 RepID=A0A3L7ACV2_9MICO|nr:FGGY-family carbohydrate kinase [Mycetocola tolaasinivorans]RLP77558.1 carbohydrate kinase [Mycetocola tolaasinivorans]
MQRRIPVLLGIDAGTTSVKTVVFDLAGEILAVSRSSVHLLRGDDGAVEADMDALWTATASTIRDALESPSGEDFDPDVVAIGITGQGDGAWLIDEAGRPVRPAALWLDGRAAPRVAAWEGDGRAEAVRAATASPLNSGALPVLWSELAERDPEAIARAHTHLNCKDWLRFKLTGVRATDPSDASRGFLNIGDGTYDEALLAAAADPRLRDILAPVLDPAAVGGRVTEESGREVGLPAGIPVAVGMVDTGAAGVGMGAIGDGEGYMILGTTGFVGVNQKNREALTTNLGIVLRTGRGEQVLETLVPMSGTPNLDWVRQTLDLEGLGWQEIEEEARRAGPGSGGVLYLPYGSPSGERAPFVDPNASASWLGMSVTTTSGQLLRSVYEGLAFALVECLDLLGLEEEVSICGGGSDSDLLCQILADVSGRRIRRQDAPEVGARGAASLALLASGRVETLAEAVSALASDSSVFAPNPERHDSSVRAYRTFITVRDALRPHWPAVRALRAH